MEKFIYELYDGKGSAPLKRTERDYTPREKNRQWKSAMLETDGTMPRALEDVIDALSPSVRSRISQETLREYNNKKKIRSQKPRKN